MTDQEIFDKVVNHLRKQGAQATNNDGECLYRAPNGRKCAFGCLMTDEEYKSEWEGVISNEIIKTELSLNRFLPHTYLIHELQYIHDEVEFNHWEESFKNCAEGFGLEYKPKASEVSIETP